MLLKFCGVNYLCRPSNYISKDTKLIVLLHGYMSNEKDLFFINNFIDKSHFVLSLRGFYNINTNSYSWYNLEINNDKIIVNSNQHLLSIKKIRNFLNEFCSKNGIYKDNIILVGFSQGASICYSLCLNKDIFIKQACILSGYIDYSVIDNYYTSATKFFLSHGEFDKIIPIHIFNKCCSYLYEKNMNILIKTYKSDHYISDSNLHDLISWINDY